MDRTTLSALVLGLPLFCILAVVQLVLLPFEVVKKTAHLYRQVGLLWNRPRLFGLEVLKYGRDVFITPLVLPFFLVFKYYYGLHQSHTEVPRFDTFKQRFMHIIEKLMIEKLTSAAKPASQS